MNKVALIVTVAQTPGGPAPEEFRKAWVGLNLLARAETYEGPEFDFVANQPLNRRKALLVPVNIALRNLAMTSPEAAFWFLVHFPPWINYFTFGADEVRIIGEVWTSPGYIIPIFLN